MLCPEKAVYWERQRALLLADPHFGKAAAFRSAGIPVPAGTTTADLRRLEALTDRTGARRLIVLGDFFHARTGRSPGLHAALEAWRARSRHLEVTLIRGNHDLRAGEPPEHWGLCPVNGPVREPPFFFSHEPVDTAGPLFCGHIHPAVTLEDEAGGRLRLPCFWFGTARAVLPSFGSFTGARKIRPRPGDRLFVAVEGEVVEVRTC